MIIFELGKPTVLLQSLNYEVCTREQSKKCPKEAVFACIHFRRSKLASAPLRRELNNCECVTAIAEYFCI